MNQLNLINARAEDKSDCMRAKMEKAWLDLHRLGCSTAHLTGLLYLPIAYQFQQTFKTFQTSQTSIEVTHMWTGNNTFL